MTTIQDRIIKDFDKLEVCYAGDKYISSWCEPLDLTEDEEKVIKQFLIQSIKEVEEETRKEILDYVEKHSNNLVPVIGNMRHNEAVLRLQNIKLQSITNKDKQNGK